MPAFAIAYDVAARWRPLTVIETVTATTLLDRVSALIRISIPTIDARIADDANLEVVARGVVVDAVLRVLRNPDGIVQETVGGYSYRRSDPVADGALYLTDSEWQQLLSPTRQARGAFTIRPGVPR